MVTPWVTARKVLKAVMILGFVVWILSLSVGSASGTDWQVLSRIELPMGSDSSFALDSRGNIYWGSRGLARIHVYDRQGRFVRSWAAGYSKGFQVVIDDHDRVFAVGTGDGAPVHAFQTDGTYLGRWIFSQVVPRAGQQAFAGESYALGRLFFLWPSITKSTIDGRTTTVVRQSLWRALLGVPMPCWALMLLAGVAWTLCEDRSRQSRTESASKRER
jgi:hypothetical protein